MKWWTDCTALLQNFMCSVYMFRYCGDCIREIVWKASFALGSLHINGKIRRCLGKHLLNSVTKRMALGDFVMSVFCHGYTLFFVGEVIVDFV